MHSKRHTQQRERENYKIISSGHNVAIISLYHEFIFENEMHQYSLMISPEDGHVLTLTCIWNTFGR